MKTGDKVTYKPRYGKQEYGTVKSVNEQSRPVIVYVVYKCNNEWNRYQDFTAQATEIDDLREGWL